MVMDVLESVHRREIGDLPPVVWLVKRYAADQGKMPWQAIHAGATFGQVEAFVNRGRWVVSCPSCDPGAALASLADPRFVCVNCGTGPLEVVFPEDRERIEAALSHRPVDNRNWLVGEDVEGEEILSAGWLIVSGLSSWLG